VKLRSRGLGRKELVMDFREYEIARDGDEVVVSGTIHEPVNWDFTIRINGDDIPGMLRVGLHRQTLALAVRWMFHRRTPAQPIPEAQSVPEVVPVSARPATPAVSPRGAAPVAAVETRARKPRPQHEGGTPDFGVPRRRGASNGDAAAAIAQGERQ
jgi:hypothetical protein